MQDNQQSQQNHSNMHYQEDEIDLRKLWQTLVDKKVFIAILTSIITLFSIVYVFTKTPIFEVKSNIQIGFIGDKLIIEPDTLVKITNLVFNVEDEIPTQKEFISEVTSISLNKKIKNFIQIKTQAISNDEALKKNKEVVSYIQNKYKDKINQFIFNIHQNIKEIEVKISNLENLETKNLQRQIEVLKTQKIVKIDENIERIKNQDIKNLQRQIEVLKTQKIVKIDEKIRFYKTIKIDTLTNKINYHKSKLKEYLKAVKQIYQTNKQNADSTSLTIASLQMVNYQNLILNSQNKVEDLKIEVEIINKETIPSLQREKKNIQNITIKDLELKINNLKKVSILNLQREKNNLQDDLLRKLEYKLKVELPNKKVNLLNQITELKFLASKQNIQNNEVVGGYIISDHSIKPKKTLIVVVAFITGLILAIFLAFFLEFINKPVINNKE